MRLRNIPGAEEILAESPFVINKPEENKGQWKVLFSNENPIYIEIGTGKGKFLMEMAERHPNINYIGIELYGSVLLRAVQRCKGSLLTNLHFICMDAKILSEVFDLGEVNRIYLNFSDPWPKDRHAKRRLTSKQFLERYETVLHKEGWLEFKTDNAELFEFSVISVKENNWETLSIHRDLHNTPSVQGNVMTEYEEKFSARGNPIHKLIAKKIQMC